MNAITQDGLSKGRALRALAGGAIALLLLGCGSKSAPPVGVTCAINTDCKAPLICAVSRCHQACVETRDCPLGQRCTKIMDALTCQLATEANCTYTSDCATPTVCAIDRQCRNQCQTERDCARNQVCTPSKVCADVGELTASGDVRAADGGVANSDGGVGDGPAADAPVSGDGPNLGDGSASPDDGATGDGAAMCNPPCMVGEQCVAGMCQGCGAMGGPCCGGSSCGANLACVAGKCACGGGGQPCCTGATCTGSLTCTQGLCSCGAVGEACCPNNTCAAGTTLACAGIKCGCFTRCDSGVLRRSDGTLWYAGKPITTLDGSGFKAEQVSYLYYNAGHACAVQSNGSAWCWGDGGAGQLGHGDMTTTQIPVQVLTAAGGAALTGVTSVAAGTGFSCAVGDAGKLWCWGSGADGRLGRGSTDASPVAVPVMTGAGGSQLADVKKVALGPTHACALKTDGSLWCWGTNAAGELGIGTSAPNALYPTAVSTLLNSVTDVVLAPNLTCAITTEGNVWCWGTNQSGWLGNGLPSGQALVPGHVLDAAGGNPFGGASRLEVIWGQICAIKTDGSLWCWGDPDRVPRARLDAASMPVNDIFQMGLSCLIRTDGTVWESLHQSTPTKATGLPPCP